MGIARRDRDPHTSWPKAGRVVALVTLALVAGIGYATTRPPLGREAVYVRIAPADEDDIEIVTRTMTWERDALRDAGVRTEPYEPGARTVAAATALDRLGDRTGPALVRALVRHDAKIERRNWSLTLPRDDAESGHPLAWRYRERATPEADAAFLAVARDRDLHIETRIPAFVALCRPGNTASLDALVDVALDVDDDEDVRRELIVRLPRIEGRAPLRLRALLDVPFDRLDYSASVALAAMGDMESPTLVLRTLRESANTGRWFGWSGPSEFGLALDGIRRATASVDPDLAQRIDQLRSDADAAASWVLVPRDLAPGTVSTLGPATRIPESIGALADRVDAWLDAHPEARATAWERTRAEAAESGRHSAAALRRSVEELEADDDAEVDVAAAIEGLILLDRRRVWWEPRALGAIAADAGLDFDPATIEAGRRADEARAATVLEDVDRVARWLRPQLAACRTPRETLDRMQALLVPRRTSRPSGINESDITSPLILRVGNCMGWTVLFVALGDRLGLPLHAVEVPRHVFVRWDDGTTRVNFDPANSGVVLTDDECAKTYGVAPAMAASGEYLRNLTRKALVSLALSNHASHTLSIGSFGNRLAPLAARLADTAARLHPRNLNAWLNLAAASARLGDAGKADLLRAAATAEALAQFTPADATRLAANLAKARLCDEAIALLDRHPDVGSENRYARALALCSLGRFADARRISVDLAADGDAAMTAFDAAVAFGVDPALGWAALDAAVVRAEDAENDGDIGPRWARPGGDAVRTTVTLAVAGHVLDDGPPSAAGARLAIAIAEKLLPEKRVQPVGSWEVRRSDVETRRDEIRARAFERLGDPGRARAIRDELKKSWAR